MLSPAVSTGNRKRRDCMGHQSVECRGPMHGWSYQKVAIVSPKGSRRIPERATWKSTAATCSRGATRWSCFPRSRHMTPSLDGVRPAQAMAKPICVGRCKHLCTPAYPNSGSTPPVHSLGVHTFSISELLVRRVINGHLNAPKAI